MTKITKETVKKCCTDLLNKKSPSNSIQVKYCCRTLKRKSLYNIAKFNEPVDERAQLYKSVDYSRILEEENALLKRVLKDHRRLILTNETQLLKWVIDMELITKNELTVQCKRDTVKPTAKILQCVTIPCNKKKPFHILFNQLFPTTQNYKIRCENLDLRCSNIEDGSKGVNSEEISFGQENQGCAVKRISLNSIFSQVIDVRMSEDTYRSSEDVEQNSSSCYEENMFEFAEQTNSSSLKDDASVNRKIKYINFADNQKTLSHSNEKINDFGISGTNFSGGIEKLQAEENKPFLKDVGVIGNRKNSSNQTTQNCSKNIKWFCVPVNKKTEINSFTEENQANHHIFASNISDANMVFNMKKTVNEEIDQTKVTNEEENIPIPVEQDEGGTSNQRFVHNSKTYYVYNEVAKQHPQSEYNDESAANDAESEYNEDILVLTSSDDSLSPKNRIIGFYSPTRARKRAKKGHSGTTRIIKADTKSSTSSKRESNEFEKCSNTRATLSVNDDFLGLASSDSSVHPENYVKASFRPTKAKKSTRTRFVKTNTQFPSTSSKREYNKIKNDKSMDCLDEHDSKFKEYSLVNLFQNINRVRNMIVTTAGRDDCSAEIKNEVFKSIGTSLEQHVKCLEGINSDEILEVALSAPGTKEAKHDKLINTKTEQPHDTKFKISRANVSSIKSKVIVEFDGEESVMDNIGSVDCNKPFWKRTSLNSPVTSGVMERSVGEDSNRVMNQTLPNYRKRNFIEDYYNKSFIITKKSKSCGGRRPKMKSSEWTVENCENEETARNQNVLSFFKHAKPVKEGKRNVSFIKTKKIGCFKSKTVQNQKFITRRGKTKPRLLKPIKESQNCVLETDLKECKPILSGNIEEYPVEQGGSCSHIEESKHNVDASSLNQRKDSDGQNSKSTNFSNQKINQPESINKEILQSNQLVIPNLLQNMRELKEMLWNLLRSIVMQQKISQQEEITQENQKSIPNQASLIVTHSGKCREENEKLINFALKKLPHQVVETELLYSLNSSTSAHEVKPEKQPLANFENKLKSLGNKFETIQSRNKTIAQPAVASKEIEDITIATVKSQEVKSEEYKNEKDEADNNLVGLKKMGVNLMKSQKTNLKNSTNITGPLGQVSGNTRVEEEIKCGENIPSSGKLMPKRRLAKPSPKTDRPQDRQKKDEKLTSGVDIQVIEISKEIQNTSLDCNRDVTSGKRQEEKEEKICITEPKIIYDPIDTNVGDQVEFDTCLQTKVIEYVYDENENHNIVTWDKELFKRTWSVVVFGDVLERIITRPIISESNDNLFHFIPSKNVHMSPESPLDASYAEEKKLHNYSNVQHPHSNVETMVKLNQKGRKSEVNDETIKEPWFSQVLPQDQVEYNDLMEHPHSNVKTMSKPNQEKRKSKGNEEKSEDPKSAQVLAQEQAEYDDLMDFAITLSTSKRKGTDLTRDTKRINPNKEKELVSNVDVDSFLNAIHNSNP